MIRRILSFFRRKKSDAERAQEKQYAFHNAANLISGSSAEDFSRFRQQQRQARKKETMRQEEEGFSLPTDSTFIDIAPAEPSPTFGGFEGGETGGGGAGGEW